MTEQIKDKCVYKGKTYALPYLFIDPIREFGLELDLGREKLGFRKKVTACYRG